MLKELYGKEENANKSAIGIIFIMCVVLSLISVRYWKYQNGGMTLIALYPMSVGIVMFFCSITAYFFKKKKSERFI
ncbi:hypothetical protein [Anaerosporobacter sp.]|uniref:hypothetical protein n=1 Tax=Anaerosporobacter sp. TaxID=1872529 RepID=UPI00286F3DFA|nr:hypothetical protein [Anaerosporobacter sp.]